MHSPGINGEGELRGNQLTQVHLEKWLLKQCACVCVCVHKLTYTCTSVTCF